MTKVLEPSAEGVELQVLVYPTKPPVLSAPSTVGPRKYSLSCEHTQVRFGFLRIKFKIGKFQTECLLVAFPIMGSGHTKNHFV